MDNSYRDRTCDNCLRAWRGEAECPTCGYVEPPFFVCGFCPDALAWAAAAKAFGYEVDYGICDSCATKHRRDIAS
jgi:hypothetical protein